MWNILHILAMLQDAQLIVGCYFADFDGVEPPLFKHAEHFVLAAFLGNQQHALLRFAQHDLVGAHAGFALGHAVEFNFDADAAASAHLAGRAGKSGRAHVLNADDRSGLHGFEASLQQEFFEKWIADLHVRTFRLRGFAEFFARHGCAVDAVTSGLGADIDHGIAFAGGARVKDFIFADEAHRECIHQRIARVARLELRLPAEVRHAEAISIGSDPADHAFEDVATAVDVFLG